MANNSAESSRYPSHHPQRDRQPAANYATRSVESVGNPTLARAEVEPTFLRCSVRTSSTRDRRRLPSTSTPVSVTPSADWPRSSRAAVRYRPRAGDGGIAGSSHWRNRRVGRGEGDRSARLDVAAADDRRGDRAGGTAGLAARDGVRDRPGLPVLAAPRAVAGSRTARGGEVDRFAGGQLSVTRST